MPAYLFIQYVLFCAAGLLTVQFIRGGLRDHLGHVLLHGMAALTVLAAIALDWHEPFALALQALLVFGPYLATLGFQRAIQRAVNASDFDRALDLARHRLVLLPFKVYRRQVRLFEGLIEARSRTREGGQQPGQVLSELARQPGLEPLYEYAVVAELSQRATQRDWPGIVAMFERGIRLPEGLYDVAAKILLVRAYCELGSLDLALGRLQTLEQHPRWRMIRSQLHVAWLAVLATGGRRRAVDDLLRHQLRHMPTPVALSWRARAAWAAGSPTEARALIAPVLETDELPQPLREVLEERMRQLRTEPPPRTGALEVGLDRLERLARTDHLLFNSVRRSFSSRPAVGWLAIVLLATFTGTWLMADPATSLPRFGAIGALLTTEPWRLFSALFAHNGWPHLLLNAVALVVFGSVVEGIFRGRSTLLLFLVAGILANLAGALTRPEALLLGPSGALLGWFGALCAAMLRAKRLVPTPWRVVLLRSFAFILGLEVALGLFSPHVGVVTLLAGSLAGFLLGLVLPLSGLNAVAGGDPAELATAT